MQLACGKEPSLSWGTGSNHELVRSNERNLTWVQQCLFLEVVQLLREVIISVIVQVVADVIEKQYKLTTSYMIRAAIQLKEIQRSAYTVCLI